MNENEKQKNLLGAIIRNWKLILGLAASSAFFGFMAMNLAVNGILPLPVITADKPFFSMEDDGIKIGYNTIRISRFRLDMGSLKIVNLAAPTAAMDAATKQYVDATSGRPMFAGYTTATTDGDMGGLDNANSKCQSEFANSYFCSVNDLVRTGNTTNPSASSWINADSYRATNSGTFYGCVGWANPSSSVEGLQVSTAGVITAGFCNVSRQVTCCKY